MPPYTTPHSNTTTPLTMHTAQWGDLASHLLNILPYGHSLANEAADMLDNIVHHFGLSLQSEDWAPGALYWAKQLNQ